MNSSIECYETKKDTTLPYHIYIAHLLLVRLKDVSGQIQKLLCEGTLLDSFKYLA
jgi:hypothetical protein